MNFFQFFIICRRKMLTLWAFYPPDSGSAWVCPQLSGWFNLLQRSGTVSWVPCGSSRYTNSLVQWLSWVFATQERKKRVYAAAVAKACNTGLKTNCGMPWVHTLNALSPHLECFERNKVWNALSKTRCGKSIAKQGDLFIDIAFITGNCSLEPLIEEGLCAQIHVNLSWRVFGRNQTGDLTD